MSEDAFRYVALTDFNLRFGFTQFSYETIHNDCQVGNYMVELNSSSLFDVREKFFHSSELFPCIIFQNIQIKERLKKCLKKIFLMYICIKSFPFYNFSFFFWG